MWKKSCSPTAKESSSCTRQYTTSSCQVLATLSKRIVLTEPGMDHLCGRLCTTSHMTCSGKPISTKVVVTKPFWKDGTMMTNTVSLCQMSGGLRNRSFNMTQSQFKIIPTWLHGKTEVGTTKSWKQSLNAEVIQVPLNQRSDFKRSEAKMLKDCMTNMQQLLEMETTSTLLGNKSGNGLICNLKPLKNTTYRAEARAGCRYYPSSRTTHSSSSTHWQQNNEWKSNGSWVTG